MASRPIFYDTETTGIKADQDRIIEIAAYDPVHNKTFEKLVNPGFPIPAEATAIHKITDEMVANSPNFSLIAQDFVQFCEGDTILIAHNNDGFDMHFLRKEFARNNVVMPNWKFFDTLKWARRYRPDLPRHTLQFLREIYEIPSNNAHRALDDVVVLHQIFMFMTDDLTMDEVYMLLNHPRLIHQMPFGKHQGVALNKIPGDYVKWLAKNGVFDKEENRELKVSFEKIGLLVTTG
jgi:DNA polymerase III subunit epsilon